MSGRETEIEGEGQGGGERMNLLKQEIDIDCEMFGCVDQTLVKCATADSWL